MASVEGLVRVDTSAGMGRIALDRDEVVDMRSEDVEGVVAAADEDQ